MKKSIKAQETIETIIADAAQNFNNGGIYYSLIREDIMQNGVVVPNYTRLFLQITTSNMGIKQTSRVQVFSTTLPILQQFAFDIAKLVGQIDPSWLSSIDADITINKDTYSPTELHYRVQGNQVVKFKPEVVVADSKGCTDEEAVAIEDPRELPSNKGQGPVYQGGKDQQVTFGRKRMDEGFDPDDVMA